MRLRLSLKDYLLFSFKRDQQLTYYFQAVERDLSQLRDYPFSPMNAPNFGEANNLTPSLYIEPDTNIKSKYKYAIYIIDETFHNNCIQRFKSARGTRYESKNDPAWHYKDTEHFELVSIVRNDPIQSPVASLDDLKLTNSDGEVLTQQYLDKMLDYMNGAITIGRISAKNTHNRGQQQQRNFSADQEKDKQAHRNAIWHLSLLDKVMLHKINLVNFTDTFGVQVIFLSTGTGPVSADVRKTAALQAPIPAALLQATVERFHAVQEHFKLLDTGKARPRYADFLHEEAIIFHLTFKPQQG